MKDSERKQKERIMTCSMQDFIKEVGVLCDVSIYSILAINTTAAQNKGFGKVFNEAISKRGVTLEELNDNIAEVFCRFASIINREAYLAEINALAQNEANMFEDSRGRIMYEKVDSTRDYKNIQVFTVPMVRAKILGLAKNIDYIPYNAIKNVSDVDLILDESLLTEATKRQIKSNSRRIDENLELFDEVIRNSQVGFIQYAVKHRTILDHYLTSAKKLGDAEWNGEDLAIDTQFDKPEDNLDLFTLTQNYIKYFDLDRVILASIFAKIYDFDNNEGKTREDAEDIRKYAESVRKLIRNKSASIDLFSSDTTIVQAFEEIDGRIHSFVNGEYCPDTVIMRFGDALLDGSMTYDSVLPEDYKKTFRFSERELFKVIQNDINSIKFFVENDIMTSEQCEQWFELLLSRSKESLLEFAEDFEDEGEAKEKGYIDITSFEFGKDTVEFLYQRELLKEKEILELYLNGYIPNEVIREVILNDTINVTELINNTGLVELYSKKDEVENGEKLNRFLKLYREINLQDKTQEEKNDLANDLIDNLSNQDLEEDTLYDLYHKGVVTCDVLLDLVGLPALRSIYASGELKPVDARRLYYDGIISDEMLDDVFSSGDIPDGQKISLIYSTFCSPEDEEKRNELITHISEVQEAARTAGTGNTRIGSTQGEAKRYNRYVTDQCYRWRLLLALDPDASTEYFCDGHEVIYLPAQGKVVVERLFEAGNPLKPAYGTATYVVDENFYAANKNSVIQDGKINRSFLVQASKNHNAIAMPHAINWEKRMCDLFELETSSIYTEEQRRQIKELADNVAQSRKLYR